MTSDQGSSNYGWCVGFSELLESSSEKKLGELWERLLQSVQSESALINAIKGPRTGWNPYRPARGEHLQQGILNSEVYEWRKVIAMNSLCIVGKELTIEGKTISPLGIPQTVRNINVDINEIVDTTTGLSSDRTAAPCTERDEYPSYDNCSETTTDVIINEYNNNNTSNNSIIDIHDPIIQEEVIEHIFHSLWRTVAVPWIMKQQNVTFKSPHNKNELEEIQDKIQNTQRMSYADGMPRFSLGVNSTRNLIPNRRRPLTGPALRRGKITGRTPILNMMNNNINNINIGQKNTIHTVQSPTVPHIQRDGIRCLDNFKIRKEQKEKEHQPTEIVKELVESHSLPKSPRQKPISLLKLTTLVSNRSPNTEVKSSVFKKLINRKPSLQCVQKTPPNVLYPRDSSPPIIRLALKARRDTTCHDKLERNVGSSGLRSSPHYRGNKLAPLSTKAKQQVPQVITQRLRET